MGLRLVCRPSAAQLLAVSVARVVVDVVRGRRREQAIQMWGRRLWRLRPPQCSASISRPHSGVVAHASHTSRATLIIVTSTSWTLQAGRREGAEAEGERHVSYDGDAQLQLPPSAVVDGVALPAPPAPHLLLSHCHQRSSTRRHRHHTLQSLLHLQLVLCVLAPPLFLFLPLSLASPLPLHSAGRSLRPLGCVLSHRSRHHARILL